MTSATFLENLFLRSRLTVSNCEVGGRLLLYVLCRCALVSADLELEADVLEWLQASGDLHTTLLEATLELLMSSSDCGR